MAAVNGRNLNGEASPSRPNPALSRKPVFPITEIDEGVDQHGNLVHENSLLLEESRREDGIVGQAGFDEGKNNKFIFSCGNPSILELIFKGDGMEPVASTMRDPDIPLIPLKRTRGKSFDKFIENLFGEKNSNKFFYIINNQWLNCYVKWLFFQFERKSKST